jgi:hypothetical protein
MEPDLAALRREATAEGGVSDRSALAGQEHVPFCKGFEGHQGTLATASGLDELAAGC